MALAVMISTFGCNNGLILAGARIYYAMARDRLFFASVGALNSNLSPAPALLVQGAWASLLCLSGTYGQLLDFLIFSVMLFYILTIGGIFVLRRTRPEMARPYKTWGYPVLPAVYIVAALFIEIQLLRYKPQYTWPGLLIVLLGMPVYWVWKKATAK
jgi:APA family basic amino acid/polyamine antiporter